MDRAAIAGAGLGLRREHIPDLRRGLPPDIDFFELAPENWLEAGGARAKDLDWFAARRPIVAHGLSLSLGGPDPLDFEFLGRVKTFLDRYRIPLYTEHLSYCAAGGQLYDLLPLPFIEEAVHHVAARIRTVQDFLERPIGVENASFYVAAPLADMDEASFVRAVLDEADCLLHLDVNNIYVNSVNFGFDPYAYVDRLPAERIAYLHTAGHLRQRPDLIIDTHGDTVAEPVWDLLDHAYRRLGVFPTLLERDFNIPPLEESLGEVRRIAQLQEEHRHGRAIRVA